MTQFVAELTAYDPSIGGTRTLIYAVKGFSSKPTDTPANTPFDERITQPLDIQRTMFASRATRGRASVAYGQIVLTNPDGALDALNEYGFDGQSLVVRRASSPVAAYPAGYSAVLFGTMQSAEFSTTEIRITVRDRLFEATSAPLQTNRYAGTNVLPAGLEGVPEDLGGKPKPVCFGVVKNVPAPCVNTSKLIYQVNDGPFHTLGGVFDRGVQLLVGRTWTSIGLLTGSLASVRVGCANGLFVAVTTDAGGTVYTSSDGETWTSRATGVGLGGMVAYGNGTWVLLTPTHSVTSPDGVTWTNHSPPTLSGTGSYNSLCFFDAAGLFVTVGTFGNISTSPDGITWTRQVNGTLNNDDTLFGVTAGFDLVVAVGQVGHILSSFDGVTWTSRAVGLLQTTGALFEVIFAADRFLASSSDIVAISMDGITWTRSTAPNFGAALPVYAGIFIASAPGSPTDSIVSSVDGFTWVTTSGMSVWGGNIVTSMASNGEIAVAVDDHGVAYFTATTSYASETDLLDDSLAPMAGEAKAYLAGGYFRLGSTPDGIVTTDVTQGATAGDRTAAAIGSLVLQRAGIDSGDIDGSLLTEMSVLGYWTMDDGVACSTVMDAAMGTVGAGWPVKADGKFHFIPLAAPSGTADLVITKDDIAQGKFERITPSDVGAGVPTYQVKVRWGKFYQTITTDLAGAVTDASRAQFAQQWRDVTATDPAVLTAHPTSQPIVLESLYSNAADAQAGANRELALRKVKRDMYAATLQLNAETLARDINSVLEIIYPRFALSVIGSPSGALEGGGLFRVLDVAPDARNDQVTFTVWGGARYKNIVDANGAYVVDANGAYVVSGIAV